MKRLLKAAIVLCLLTIGSFAVADWSTVRFCEPTPDFVIFDGGATFILQNQAGWAPIPENAAAFNQWLKKVSRPDAGSAVDELSQDPSKAVSYKGAVTFKRDANGKPNVAFSLVGESAAQIEFAPKHEGWTLADAGRITLAAVAKKLNTSVDTLLIRLSGKNGGGDDLAWIELEKRLKAKPTLYLLVGDPPVAIKATSQAPSGNQGHPGTTASTTGGTPPRTGTTTTGSTGGGPTGSGTTGGGGSSSGGTTGAGTTGGGTGGGEGPSIGTVAFFGVLLTGAGILLGWVLGKRSAAGLGLRDDNGGMAAPPVVPHDKPEKQSRKKDQASPEEMKLLEFFREQVGIYRSERGTLYSAEQDIFTKIRNAYNGFQALQERRDEQDQAIGGLIRERDALAGEAADLKRYKEYKEKYDAYQAKLKDLEAKVAAAKVEVEARDDLNSTLSKQLDDAEDRNRKQATILGETEDSATSYVKLLEDLSRRLDAVAENLKNE